MIDTFATLALLALVVSAVVWDVRTRRIPNVVTVLGLLSALGLRAFQGPGAVAAGLLAALLAFGLAAPLVVIRAMGAGDAKLLAAIGAFVGPAGLPVVLLVTAIAGGVLALAAAARRGALGETLAHARALVGPRGARPRRTLETPGALAVPYAVAIAAGALAGWWA